MITKKCEGFCPGCNSKDIDYGRRRYKINEEDEVHYPFLYQKAHCNTCDRIFHVLFDIIYDKSVILNEGCL